jgi:hypothetical protein
MLRYDWKISAWSAVVLAGALAFAGCGDDDDGGTQSGGGSGGSGAKAGSGGSKGGAGGNSSTETGSGGKAAGSGGKGSAGGGGASGSSAAGSGGSGGAGGSEPKDYPDLSNIEGKVLTSLNALSGITFAADGKVYASGDINIVDESKGTGDTAADKYRTSVTGHKIAVLRFLADGTADKDFGTDGQVTWEGPAGDATTMSLAETDDGSVVVDVNLKYESKRTGVALVKFDKTGKLVESFGTGGRLDVIFGWKDDQVADFPKDAMGTVRYPSDQSWDLKAAAGGKKLVLFASGPAAHGQMDDSVSPAVQRADNDRFIVRLSSSDGSIDSGFNDGAVSIVNTPNDGFTGMQPKYPSDGGRHGIVESDGSMVSAGYTGYGDDKGNQIVIVRLKPDGKFDSDFHKERAGQPKLSGVAVFNPVPEADKGFAECYGLAHTAKGYVTTGYGNAYGGDGDESSLGYLKSQAVDMVSARFTGTEVDNTWGKSGVYAAQSEVLGADKVSIFEDRGRSPVIGLADGRVVMAGRFGSYASVFVLTEAGEPDTRIKGKDGAPDGMLLFPTLTSEKQPNTSLFYGLALSPDGKHLAASANNHEQGALIAFLELKDDGSITSSVIE